MYINSAIILEPEKGKYINDFIYDILSFKEKNDIETTMFGKFNDVCFEITSKNNYDDIYQSYADAYFNNKE